MFIISRIEFYNNLQTRIIKYLDQMYSLLVNVRLINTEKKLKFNETKVQLLDDLNLRKYYTDVDDKKNPQIQNEILLGIYNVEKLLLDMLREPMIFNEGEKKSVQLFFTLLSNYLDLICYFENSTRRYYDVLESVLEKVLNNILIE